MITKQILRKPKYGELDWLREELDKLGSLVAQRLRTRATTRRKETPCRRRAP